MKTMTIGKVAKKSGVGVETIRFYEKKDLVAQPPKPPFGGFRVYPAETVERIRFIRQAQDLGFSLREIKELLSLRLDPTADCADVRNRAQVKLKEITRKIAAMKGIQTALEKLVSACPGEGSIQVCSIIESIETSERTRTELKKQNKIKKGGEIMNNKRKVEIFSAGCTICEEVVSIVRRLACSSCEVIVLDMLNPNVAKRAKNLRIGSLPAVVIEGRLVDCCGQGINEETLRAAGLGQAMGH